MYAIVNINGTQARVAKDEVIEVPRLKGEPGDTITLGNVLLFADGDTIKLGQPLVEGVSLTAEVVEHFRGPKLRVFKFKRRREYRRRQGHRDERTRLRVTAFNV